MYFKINFEMTFTITGLDLYIERISFKAVSVDTTLRRLEEVLLLQQLLKLRLFKRLWLYKRDIGIIERLLLLKMIVELPFEDFKQ